MPRTTLPTNADLLAMTAQQDSQARFSGRGESQIQAGPLVSGAPQQESKEIHVMILESIPIESIDLSEFNARKDLRDGQQDSGIEDLANSIERRGLLNPITVFRRADKRYELVAGQRRYLACQHLGWQEIPALVRESMGGAVATATSLVENFHRADMNPNDKIDALNLLLADLGDVHAVARETGLTAQTIRKYLQMAGLASELRDQLAAGETRSTEALARLARTFNDPEKQLQVWDRIGALPQGAQQEVLRAVDPELENLDDLVDQAVEGSLGYHIVRHCPSDCPSIPEPLKERVAEMIERFRADRRGSTDAA